MYKLNKEWTTPELDFLSKRVLLPIKDVKYEKAYRAFVYKHHPNKNVMIDIGANIGIFAKPCSEHFNQVHAFEPAPKIADCLKINVKNCTNVFVYNNAIGTKLLNANFYYNQKNTGGTKQVNVDITEKRNENIITVDVLPLDEYEFDDVNFIKIDTEGYELSVLESSRNIIKKYNPWILFENSGDKNNVIEYVLSIGQYQVYTIPKHKRNTFLIPLNGKNSINVRNLQ